MEIDRVKFVLASYLRARLFKIERHVAHVVAVPEMYNRLSVAEMQYAKGYLDVVHGHFKQSALDRLPENFRGMYDESAGATMPKPNLNKFVFSRAERNIGGVQMDSNGATAVIQKGDIYALRYQPVAGIVADGQLKLL